MTQGASANDSPTQFRLSEAWTIAQAEQSLIIHGGADARYEIVLDDAAPSSLAALAPGAHVTRAELSDSDRGALEQLVTARIIVPVVANAAPLRVALAGDPFEWTLDSPDVRLTERSAPHDLLVIVRTTSTYSELLNSLHYDTLDELHLLVDLAFHHTVSLGPLVFPGETACLACLKARIERLWGDDAPPPEPEAPTRHAALARVLAQAEVERIADSDTSLTNATVSWNLLDRSADTQQLLKVPLCHLCTRATPVATGSLALPWTRSS